MLKPAPAPIEGVIRDYLIAIQQTLNDLIGYIVDLIVYLISL